MAAKSLTQRIVEAVAVVLVAVAAVPVMITVAGRYWPKQPPKPADATNAVPTPQFEPDPVPVRQYVDSVEKLPQSYPAIDDVVLRANLSWNRGRLAETESAALQGIQVRHLNAYSSDRVYLLPPDGRLAIVDEMTPANTHRLAVWDVQAGKLLRFLGQEDGPTQPYQGQENASFGAKIDFDSLDAFAVSPSGRRCAARHGSWSSPENISVYVWDVASGKLLLKYDEYAEVHDIFLFPSDDDVVINAACGRSDTMIALRREESVPSVMRGSDLALVRLRVNHSAAELLTPPGVGGARHFGRGAAHDGMIAFTGELDLHTVNLNTGEHRQGAAAQAGGALLYSAMWFSPDGQRLLGCENDGQLDTWDVSTARRIESVKLKEQNVSSVLPAQGAGIVLLQTGDIPSVDVFDVATKKLISVIHLPFRKGRIKAITSDAKRMLVATDQSSLLVVDFPQQIPRGEFDVASLLSKKLAATR